MKNENDGKNTYEGLLFSSAPDEGDGNKSERENRENVQPLKLFDDQKTDGKKDGGVKKEDAKRKSGKSKMKYGKPAKGTKAYNKSRRKAYAFASLLFICVLTAGFLISMAFFARPSYSDSEKRELASFPSFSFTALFDGSYFDDIGLWFSDTFPFRDSLTELSSKVKSFLGLGDSIHNFSENEGDEIPEAESISQQSVDIDAQIIAEDEDIGTALPAGSDEPITSGQTTGGDTLEQNLGSIYVYGNTGYEYYNFVQSTADSYISTVNSAADSVKSSGINVYSMLIPTSIDITLNESSRSKLNSSDQKEAINYISSGLNDNVTKVLIFDLLKNHSDEYLYFRTDHHWTALGAYYAYAQLMDVMGEDYLPLSDFTMYKFDNFLGSFYSDTGKSPALGNTPDTVYAFDPPCGHTYKFRQKGSSEFTDYPLICDATDFSSSNKYLCFAAGDQPIGIIENTDMTEGKSCIIVKESFGNCFAPYLISHYKYVYIIDFRYFDQDITDFAIANGVSDIIVANNMSMTRNSSLVEKLGEIL
ncbi:MAG: hypothetical protein LUH40_05985 [Clostridiales bacterium]|nr:hypothetical protein [Clostridiales bacterium]